MPRPFVVATALQWSGAFAVVYTTQLDAESLAQTLPLETLSVLPTSQTASRQSDRPVVTSPAQEHPNVQSETIENISRAQPTSDWIASRSMKSSSIFRDVGSSAPPSPTSIEATDAPSTTTVQATIGAPQSQSGLSSGATLGILGGCLFLLIVIVVVIYRSIRKKLAALSVQAEAEQECLSPPHHPSPSLRSSFGIARVASDLPSSWRGSSSLSAHSAAFERALSMQSVHVFNAYIDGSSIRHSADFDPHHQAAMLQRAMYLNQNMRASWAPGMPSSVRGYSDRRFLQHNYHERPVALTRSAEEPMPRLSDDFHDLSSITSSMPRTASAPVALSSLEAMATRPPPATRWISARTEEREGGDAHRRSSLDSDVDDIFRSYVT
ncbi:hypothetical protein AeNC1_003235 [Aphanomyces euteiches]|nr:hypothetical protein AeNC1_003235 [Aphanomyces euteiches]